MVGLACLRDRHSNTCIYKQRLEGNRNATIEKITLKADSFYLCVFLPFCVVDFGFLSTLFCFAEGAVLLGRRQTLNARLLLLFLVSVVRLEPPIGYWGSRQIGEEKEKRWKKRKDGRREKLKTHYAFRILELRGERRLKRKTKK